MNAALQLQGLQVERKSLGLALRSQLVKMLNTMTTTFNQQLNSNQAIFAGATACPSGEREISHPIYSSTPEVDGRFSNYCDSKWSQAASEGGNPLSQVGRNP